MTVATDPKKTGVAAQPSLTTLSRLLASKWSGKPVANEAMWYDGTFGTTNYGINSRKRYIANRQTGYVRLVYAAAGNYDSLPNEGIAVRAALEPTSGATRQRVYFNGQVEGFISPGGVLISDPVQANIASGQQFWVWTFASGPHMPLMASSFNNTISAWSEGSDTTANAGATDKTLSIPLANSNGTAHYSPIAVIGDSDATLPFVGCFGDSIGAGLGDGTVVDAGRGFFRRAMNNTIPFINLCASGDAYTNASLIRYGLFNGCTDVVDEMGINDVAGGATLAQMQARMLAAWQKLGQFGARVWRTTLTPSTSSTDVWATLANQTVRAYEGVRTGVNDWIRDGAPVDNATNLSPQAVGTAGALRAGGYGHPLYGYFETADAVESARNSGKWIVGSVYTTDATGLHPSSTGYAAIAATINTARFTA